MSNLTLTLTLNLNRFPSHAHPIPSNPNANPNQVRRMVRSRDELSAKDKAGDADADVPKSALEQVPVTQNRGAV